MICSVLLIALGSFLGADAMAALGTTCDVYEQENVRGLCAKGTDQCNAYCQKKFGAESLAAECSAERPNKQRECICRLKCCTQGCWGDPHCTTCDGVKFGYQGMKKHYLFKPMKNYPTMPYFTITQINKVYQKGPMAILDISELEVRDWKLVVEVKTPHGPAGYILKVNDKVQTIPFRWSKIEDNRERFVNIVYGNNEKTQVVMTTSFGVRIVYTTNGVGGENQYSDFSIDTPRHPELKELMHGLMGRPNGNPDDDTIDANGKKQPVEEGFSWAFGDSWIVPGGRTKTPECVRDDAVKNKDDHVGRVDPKVKEAAEKTCKAALDDPELQHCAKKLNRSIPLLKNCIIDLIFLDSDKKRKEYVTDVVNSFRATCKRREKAEKEREKEKDKEAVGFALEG